MFATYQREPRYIHMHEAVEDMTDPSVPFTRMSQRDDILRELFDGLALLFRPSIVCDVGAFNGDESFRFAQILPEARIHAFEASPNNFRQFFVEDDRLVAIPNLTAVHTAVANRTGTINLNVLQAGDESSDWRRAANSIRARAEPLSAETITVPCTTLDDYFGSDAISANTFALWIDVEGALEDVVLGAQSVLKRTLLIRAEMEWKELWIGQKLAPEMKTFIEDLGFTTFGDTFLRNGYDQSDILFVNKNLLGLLAEQRFGP